MDSDKNIIYTKSFYLKSQSYSKIEWANDSNFLLLFNKTEICLLNLFNFSTKYWTNFQNEIKVKKIFKRKQSISISSTDNRFFVFVENSNSFMYIINEASNDIYDNRYLENFNNLLPNGYFQQFFKTFSKVFFFSETEEYQIIKTAFNYTDDRLIVLFGRKNSVMNNIIRVYKVNNTQNIHKLHLEFG